MDKSNITREMINAGAAALKAELCGPLVVRHAETIAVNVHLAMLAAAVGKPSDGLFAAWLADACDVDTGDWSIAEPVGLLFESWTEYQRKTQPRFQVDSSKAFHHRMRAHGFTYMRANSGRHWRYVRLKIKA